MADSSFLYRVYALAVSGTDLYAGGQFSAPANSIAKWNGSNWAASGSGMDGYVSALAVSGQELYAGGFTFTIAGGNLVKSLSGARVPGQPWGRG